MWLQTLTSPLTLTLDFQNGILKLLYLRNWRVDSLGMKGMWVGYDFGCTMGLTLGHGAWQIDRPSNGSVWNSYSFQPLAQWMGYSFTDLGAEGCCRSLIALFIVLLPPIVVISFYYYFSISHRQQQKRKGQLGKLTVIKPIARNGLFR